ncbi:MAG: YybS family protein [Syntrophotalea acetylenica]|uniref:YybS family protein n=1 Tax=Syntrophotalea TaxID=2812025 RepID=UPI000A5A8655|nr:YybS family protein [Syntrophotalea acetylenica]MDD4456084.1 YybS family protein [Syntrophotalea acetylenica]MDY0261142.1 YybS family protein [Syntrophotalea acetylenica]
MRITQRLLSLSCTVVLTIGLQAMVAGLISQAQNSLLTLMGSVMALCVSWPVALLVVRQGVADGIAAVLASAVILGGWAGWPFGAAYLCQFGLASLIVSGLLHKGCRWDRVVAIGTGTIIAIGSLGMTAYAVRIGKNPLQLADEWANREVNRALEALKTADLPPEMVQQTQALFRDLGHSLIALYPAVIILTVAVMLLATVWFLNRRTGALLPEQVAFCAWKVPENLIWVLIAGGVGTTFLQGGWQRLAWNVLVVVLGIYFLQGLAILSHYFRVKRFPPAFRAIGYFLVVASFPLRVLATGVGIFDLWIDFRKPGKHKD